MYDLLIKNGLLYDGTGANAYRADIGVVGDRIARIGDLRGQEAAQVIDATGKAVTPGFIDPHSHADLSILINPSMEAYLMQGVTTVVGGNCGHSMGPIGSEIYRSAIIDFPLTFAAEPKYFDLVSLLLPREAAAKAWQGLYGIELDWHSFGDYIDTCNRHGMDANIAPLVGYSAVRNAVMGADCMREATPEELDRLAQIVADSMEAGAFGLSTGLDPQYVPGPYATDEETIRMLKIVRAHDGIFTSHTFNVGPDGVGGRMEGYKKMLTQAKAAGVRANVSHVHLLGMAATPEDAVQAARDTLAYFEQMQQEGLDLSYDVIPTADAIDFTIPYFAFFLRPFVLMSGSRAHLAENFRVGDFRQMVRTVLQSGMYPSLDPSQPLNYYGMLAITRHTDARCIGKSFAALAADRRVDPLELMMDLFAQDPDMAVGMGSAGFTAANDLLCSHPMAMPCSDGFSCTKDTNLTANAELPLYPNPMNLSFIPRFLLRSSRPRFEDTVRQASGLVAERFGIRDRGVLRVGAFADIVVLDRDKLRCYDEAENALQYPDGFEHVIVNGIPTIANKRHLGACAGRMLRKSD